MSGWKLHGVLVLPAGFDLTHARAQVFDLAFSESLAPLTFRSRYEAGSLQVCKVRHRRSRLVRILADHQMFDHHLVGVFCNHMSNRFQECRLTVVTLAKEADHDLFRYIPGDRTAKQFLKVTH